MIGIAAGLAATGKVPFASSFAMFAAGRAFEQVRNSVGYPHLNVKIGATHAGISVGEDGATHQCNEDIALMRTIPGLVILNPSDDIEAKAAVKAAYEHEGPVYMRFGRLAVPIINDRPDYKFEIGKGVTLREGKDVAIIATGLCVSESLAAAEKLAADGETVLKQASTGKYQEMFGDGYVLTTSVAQENDLTADEVEQYKADYSKRIAPIIENGKAKAAALDEEKAGSMNDAFANLDCADEISEVKACTVEVKTADGKVVASTVINVVKIGNSWYVDNTNSDTSALYLA